MQKSDKFNLHSLSVITSFRCNLNCKYCGSYVPYLKNKLERSNDEIMKGVERFFRIVDKVELLTVSGGEPLIYKDFADLLERLLSYKERFDRMQIISNGTIVPSNDVLRIIKKYGGKFHVFFIDNYGKNISRKIPEIEAALKVYGVPCYIRDYCTENAYCGGWVDMGDCRNELHTLEEAQRLYEKCAIRKWGFCSMLADDIWYPCDQVFRRLDLGQKVDPNDYIDLTDKTLTVEQQREKFKSIYGNKCLESCKYCSGLCQDSVRIKPAEQLSPEELWKIREESNK